MSDILIHMVPHLSYIGKSFLIKLKELKYHAIHR